MEQLVNKQITMYDIEINDKPICTNCRTREGTEKFADSEIMFARGYYQIMCKQCVYEIQIVHMTKCAEELPNVKAALEALLKA